MKPAYVQSHLKDMNRQLVYNYLRDKGETSKAEIARSTRISGPTVLKIVDFLIKNDLVLETTAGTGAVGRKPQLLALNNSGMYTLNFFLEGDFLSIGVVDCTGRVVHKRLKKVIPQVDAIFSQITDNLVETTMAEAEVPLQKLVGVGIALPAIYNSAEMTISSAPLIGVDAPIPLHAEIDKLAHKYGVRVVIENDTNAQALGEFRLLALDREEDLIFLSLGTGLGAGVILDGKLRRGSRYMCGEIGYFAFMEDTASTPGDAGWLESRINYRALEDRFGIRFDVPASEWGEAAVQSVVEYVTIPVALCINNMTMFMDCGTVVLGGVIADTLGDRLLESLNEKLRAINIAEVQVRRQSSSDVGIIGTASILMEEKIKSILSA